jgi:hypothetical protein
VWRTAGFRARRKAAFEGLAWFRLTPALPSGLAAAKGHPRAPSHHTLLRALEHPGDRGLIHAQLTGDGGLRESLIGQRLDLLLGRRLRALHRSQEPPRDVRREARFEGLYRFAVEAAGLLEVDLEARPLHRRVFRAPEREDGVEDVLPLVPDARGEFDLTAPGRSLAYPAWETFVATR